MSNLTASTQPKTRKFINLKFLIGAFDADATALDDKDCPFIEAFTAIPSIELRHSKFIGAAREPVT